MSTSTRWPADVTRFVHRWQQWKVAREREPARPHGSLSPVSLDWLSDSPQRYPGVPGTWWQDTDAAYLDPGDAAMSVDGHEVVGVHRFELVNSGPGVRVSWSRDSSTSTRRLASCASNTPAVNTC